MSELCTDNRFEIIAKAKEALLDSTNIESSPDEMACLDSFLFRCWQMGWLDKYEKDLVEVVRCKDCKYITEHYDVDGNVPYWTCSEWDSGTDYDGFCSYGERQDHE